MSRRGPATSGNWNRKSPFDAVLLDAPCSATGTIRRHPDVPWIKKPVDIEKLGAIQKELLERVVDWVRPGGLLVYCTCSLETAEGEAQVEAFMKRQRGRVELVPVTADEIGGLTACVSDAGFFALPALSRGRPDSGNERLGRVFCGPFQAALTGHKGFTCNDSLNEMLTLTAGFWEITELKPLSRVDHRCRGWWGE